MFAAPALASVSITMAQVGDTNEVIISITSTEANLIRAYSLDIKLTANGGDPDPNILEVSVLNPGYWVFPGTIQIDASGNVTNLGSPVAEYGDLPQDTLAGLDSNGVTVELASLYAPVGPGSPNAPAQNGALLSVKVSGDACITVTANESRAGASGVVMEDPAANPTVNLPGELCILVVGVPPECYYGMADYAQWEIVGKPDCWCYPRQCLGDADGLPYGKLNYWVSIPDLTILKDAWNKTAAQLVGVDACADFDHLPYGKLFYRVSIPDLTILKDNWSIANGPAPTCLPGNEEP
jgi:hypothetical protein